MKAATEYTKNIFHLRLRTTQNGWPTGSPNES